MYCVCCRFSFFLFFFFFNDTATTEIYTLSLHDALPIYARLVPAVGWPPTTDGRTEIVDRKSTRLNSSHGSISYAVFCLKKKKNNKSSHKPSNNKHHKHNLHPPPTKQ